MKIVVDAFGGDKAPLEIVKGASWAVEEYGVDIVLAGDKEALEELSVAHGISMNRMEILHAPDIIRIEDDAVEGVKRRKQSSIVAGLEMLHRGEADGFVSAGSTAAVTVGATLIAKRIRGIQRAAIGTLMPTVDRPVFLVDTGANAVCRPSMLLQFAVMGSIFMTHCQGVANPRVGLLNIGAEEEKGTELQTETYKLLQKSGLNFVGNIEGRDVALGACDVIVADGFSGNILLKTTEGVGLAFMSMLKGALTKNLKSKIGATMIMDGLRDLKRKLDYSEYGGSPLVGISAPVIKAHGSSNAKAIKNAIRQAIEFKNSGTVEHITAAIAGMKEEIG